MEIDEPSILLSQQIRKFASQAIKCKKCGNHLKTELTELLGNPEVKTISFDLVQDIHKTLESNGNEIYLHEMISDSDLFLPSPPPPVRNPELQARIDKLKLQQANREYKEMTKNVDLTQKYDGDRFGDDIKSLNRHLIAVLNFIVTVGGAFAFGYKSVEYSVGSSLPLQMMSGLIFATVVFFADLYFLLKYHSD